MKHSTLSLFTGAGGLDIGLEAAGYSVCLCVENDEDARQTLAINRPQWALAEPGDIFSLQPQEVVSQAGITRGNLSLLAGGPPCQPFSKSAYWSNGGSNGMKDPRARTLHAFLDVVDAVLPNTLILENVTGLTVNGKDDGLRLIRANLEKINQQHGTNYQVQVLIINAAEYGVPQIRERVFILANSEGKQLELPPVTHGNGEDIEPFRTSWDAIGDLDVDNWPSELDPTGKWADLLQSIPEGKNYQWHTPRGGGEPLFGWRTRYWSFLLKLAKSRPSWTVQAAPGPATGPFHWKSRRLSIEEIARLQTFPVTYEIVGDHRSGYRQIGNAVPCAIGELIGLEIRRQFFGERVRRKLHLIPHQRADCPPPEPPSKVPKRYLPLRANHQDHPGPGMGPGAQARGHSQQST